MFRVTNWRPFSVFAGSNFNSFLGSFANCSGCSRSDGSVHEEDGLVWYLNAAERVTLELRADFTNFTNSPSFGFPTTTITSATFGRIRDTVVSSSRQTMLAAKISF